VEVDLDAIRANARAICKHLRGTRLLAVVKEDGYGHGGPEVARALSGIASGFGVATVAQGEALRARGVRECILVLCPVPGEEWPRLKRARLTPALTSQPDLARASVGSGGMMEGHLKFDTGVGRVGFHYLAAPAVARCLVRRGVRRLRGVFTHLSRVYERKFTEAQLDRFTKCLSVLHKAGISAELIHVANSGAVYLSPRACAYGTVRPGLILYGCPPGPGVPFTLRPALSFKTRIAEVRRVPAGVTVSYGHTYTTRRQTILAALPVGYSAGYSRLLSGRAHVLLRGRRVPVRGRVCMNLTIVEVERTRVGEEVTLIGSQGRSRIDADELARHMGTISYEVLLTVGGLNPREYLGGRNVDS
jgi:alanine racemase